jgi:2-amino-4-hydroxy-6-hydroxymethyldihydropteridine diphosphokinase
MTSAPEDRIFLRGLTVECLIGFIDWERRVKQKVVIDLEMPVDCRRAARTDRVEDTLDYKRVAKRIIAFVEGSEFHLVEPLRHLALAGRELARAFPGVRFSSAYRNPAVGFDGEDFVNLVAAFDTTASPEEVLEQLHRIEALCGRPRDAPKWAPRTMDLDVLLFGDLVGERPGLTLPRPDLLRRPYMLGPAAEVAPETRHPVRGETLAALWAAFDPSGHALQRMPFDLAP